MAAIQLCTGQKIGDYKKPYFVAEMNSSHNGNIETAKKMIDAASEAGCDAVKFQSWSADSLYSKTYYSKNPIAKRMVGKFALSEDALTIIADYCREKHIGFSSTPYSNEEVDLLVKLQAPYIKVASMDLNNLLFLRYIGEKGLPIVLSTGMGTLDEIHKAVDVIEKTGNSQICILHCVSIYPVDSNNVNLNNIRMLRQEFQDYPIGYSDHTIGSEIACAAVAFGAAIIEKHFTLDNSKIGWDNQMAMEPGKMKKLIQNCLSVYEGLGSFGRVVSKEELEQRRKMRRSIVAKCDLEEGHIIRIDDLDSKRPGDGISPEQYEDIIGKRTICTIKKDEMFNGGMFV